MHALHEPVEVRAHLAIERQRFVEHIDQVGLAAADTAPEVEPHHLRLLGCLGLRRLALAEQPRHLGKLRLPGDSRGRLGSRASLEIVIQALQMFDGILLRGVVAEVITFQIGTVA